MKKGCQNRRLAVQGFHPWPLGHAWGPQVEVQPIPRVMRETQLQAGTEGKRVTKIIDQPHKVNKVFVWAITGNYYILISQLLGSVLT